MEEFTVKQAAFTNAALEKIRHLGIQDKLSDLAKAMKGLKGTETTNGLYVVEYRWYLFIFARRTRYRNGRPLTTGWRIVDVQINDRGQNGNHAS